MPKQVELSVGDFEEIRRELTERRFRLITSEEVQKIIREKSLKASRPREGREAGFVYRANGLTVTVWTTWLIDYARMARSDSGWVVIEGLGEKGERKYFSHPIHRTKGFVQKLVYYARLARWRVKNRPPCLKCNQFMIITSGKALKSRYWTCSRIMLHEDRERAHLSWDWGLPSEALEYVKKERKPRAKRRAHLKKEGKSPRPAMLSRKTWQDSRRVTLS